MSTTSDVFARIEPSRVMARSALANYCEALAVELRVIAAALVGEPVSAWYAGGEADDEVVLVAESGTRHRIARLERDTPAAHAVQFVCDAVFLHRRSSSLLALTRTERDAF